MEVLVLGDGLLGSEIVKQTGWNYISRKKDRFDFNYPDTYLDKLIGYNVIVNCIANTDTYSTDEAWMKWTNYYSVMNLTDYCKKKEIILVHISTDYVYANSVPFAKETDIPLISPNWYTYYKLLADEYVIKNNPFCLVCRCSFKPRPFPYSKAWSDLIGNFDYVDVIADLIIKLIRGNASGLYNVGTEIKSVYSLAKRTNSNVEPIKSPDYAPKNVTMDLTKLNSFFGYYKSKF